MSKNPLDLPIQQATRDGLPDELRAQAWKNLLSDPDASFQRLMEYGALRSAIEDAHSDWTDRDQKRLAFISRFGDVAARHLLTASEGCSLQERYRFARLLGILLPGSQPVIEVAARDESTDEDRRRTAQLALKLAGSTKDR